MDRAETHAFNRGFLPHYKGWYSRIEYAPGGSAGNPDALLLFSGIVLPLEVKIGKMLHNGLVRVKVRASQVLWHRNFQNAGGRSAFFIQSPGKSWAWVLPGSSLDAIIDGELGPAHDMSRLASYLAVCAGYNEPFESLNVGVEKSFEDRKCLA